jgi:hypothetical protein
VQNIIDAIMIQYIRKAHHGGYPRNLFVGFGQLTDRRERFRGKNLVGFDDGQRDGIPAVLIANAVKEIHDRIVFQITQHIRVESHFRDAIPKEDRDP